jgi:hypothetical protein
MVEELGTAGSGGAFCFGGSMAGNAGPDWSTIRAEYENSATPITELAQAHGVTLPELRRMRQRERWQRRNVHVGGAAHEALIGQLFGLFENQLVQLGDLVDEEHEPQVLALGRMAQTLERLIELDIAHRATQRSKPSNPQLEEIRKRLSRRIYELEQRTGE